MFVEKLSAQVDLEAVPKWILSRMVCCGFTVAQPGIDGKVRVS